MKSSLKRVITVLLAAVMLAAIPCVPAFGAQEYYVNDGENTLALADAYAIGADGSTAKLPERGVYAATASGTQLLGGRSAPRDVFVEDWLRGSNNCISTGKGGGSRTLNITPRATSPSTRRESLISRTFCASASRSSSPRRAARRSRSTGCATALRASPTDRMCRCSASRRRWGTAQHP